MLVKRTWAGKKTAAAAGLAHAEEQADRQAAASARGAAIQGRMLQIALREQLPIWTETPVRDFVVENGRVVGVVVQRDGKRRARAGARWRADERRRLLAQRGDARALPAAAELGRSGPMRIPATPAR